MKAKLILKAGAPRDVWAHVRNTGIGGSDAGVILGVNKWKTPFQLWQEKTGAAEAEDLSGNEAVYWGTVLEPLVARRFEEETGKKVHRRGTLQDTEHPFMLANVDRWVQGENAGLEIKTANAFAGSDWEDDEVPPSYIAQCTHYMAVTGAEKWYIAVLLGGQKFVWKEIPRIEDNISYLREQEAAFWKHVTDRTHPDITIDGSEACREALEARFAKGRPQECPLPESAALLFEKYDAALAAKKAADAEMQAVKTEFMNLLGPYEFGRIGRRKVTWKAPKPRESLTVGRLKAFSMADYERLKASGIVTETTPQRALRVY